MCKSVGVLTILIVLLANSNGRSAADSPVTVIENARELIADGDFAEARDLLLNDSKTADSTGESIFLLALARLGAGDFSGAKGLDSAAEMFERAARAGYHYPEDRSWDYEDIQADRYINANWRAASPLLKSKDQAKKQTACNLLWNVIAVDPKANGAAEKLGQVLIKDGLTGEALQLYVRLLRLLPIPDPGLHGAGQNFLELTTPEQGKTFLKYLATRPSDSLSALEELFAARACFTLDGKQDSAACAHYHRGLDRLDSLAAIDYWRDLKDLTTEAERKEYGALATVADRQSFLRLFWRSRELMPGDNLRLIEHYRRLNYARRFYGVSMGNGYDDMGRIYIRHGKPDNVVRPSMNMAMYDNESWQYIKKPKDYIFHFVRKFKGSRLEDDLSAALRPGGSDEENALLLSELYEERSIIDPRYNGIAMDLKDNSQMAAQRLSKSLFDNSEIVAEGLQKGQNSETFKPFPGVKPLDYYYCTADFMSPDSSSAMYVFYGVPVRQLEARDSQVSYECRLALFDRDWNPTAQSAGERKVRLERKPSQYDEGALLVSNQSLSLRPGRYNCSFSVKDLNSEHLGVYRDTISVVEYPRGRFGVSSVVLATGVREVGDGPAGQFTRGRMNIEVLPSRTFSRNQQAFIYCEIYNLHADSIGGKNYRTELTVSAEKPDQNLAARIVSPFGRLLGKKEDSHSVSMTFEKRQSDPGRMFQQEHLALDTGDSAPGRYTLRLTVTDAATGERVTRTSDFFVVKSD